MDLLEQALAATAASKVEVVSEQHDVNQINYGGDQAVDASFGTRPSEPWDGGEYGISLADAQAKWDAARTPEARAAVVAELRERAIRRAGLDTSNGRVNVMVAGKAPWHGLGVLVREAVGSGEAIKLAGLNWEVKKQPLNYFDPITNTMKPAKDAFAIVRQDTGEMLGTVGKLYTPFQNASGFEFLDKILDRFGARYESAGSIYKGKRVWMLVHLPKQRFTVNGSDQIEPYAIFCNSHDGTTAARCFPTSQRVVCANTFRLAQSEADKGLTIRHTGNLRDRVESAERALGLAVQQVDEFKAASEVMARTRLNPLEYVHNVLDVVCDVTAADVAKGASLLAAAIAETAAERAVKEAEYQRAIDKRATLLDDVLDRYHSGTNGVNGMRGTAWAAFNAVTESADHGKLGGRYVGADDNTRSSRRFESVLTGNADHVKQVAYEQILTKLPA